MLFSFLQWAFCFFLFSVFYLIMIWSTIRIPNVPANNIPVWSIVSQAFTILALIFSKNDMLKASLFQAKCLSSSTSANFNRVHGRTQFLSIFFIYRPLLILSSLGLSASSGIAQYDPIFIAPGIRPALQRSLIHLAERFHFFAVCLIDK